VANAGLFQCIDFDRTLFDTSRFVEALTSEVDRLHPGMGAELNKKFEVAYKAEKTFFVMRYLRETLGNQEFKQLIDAVQKKHQGDRFLLPGALERLELADQLSDRRPSFGILTYGDVMDQVLKLTLAGLGTVPVFMTDTPHKAAILAGWQQSDDTFRLPDVFGGQSVSQLTLEDDKLRAFPGLPKGVVGVWLRPDEKAGGHKELSTKGGVVTEAATITESGELLKHLFSH
jgi:hypothetical protein